MRYEGDKPKVKSLISIKSWDLVLQYGPGNSLSLLLSWLLLVDDCGRGGKGAQVARHQHATTLTDNIRDEDEVIQKCLIMKIIGSKDFAEHANVESPELKI